MSSEEIAALRAEVAELKDRVVEVSQLKARVAELEATVNPARKNEKHYQKILERQLAATHLHIPGVGYTDLTTPDAHIEIKRFKDYHVVPGQLAKYNHVLPRSRKCVYFFGPLPDEKRLELIADLMAESGIEMYIFDQNDVPYQCSHSNAALKAARVLAQFRRLKIKADTKAAMKATSAYVAFEEWATTLDPSQKTRKAVAALFEAVFGVTKSVRGWNHETNVRGWKGYVLTE
jgi:hypothetical protein